MILHSLTQIIGGNVTLLLPEAILKAYSDDYVPLVIDMLDLNPEKKVIKNGEDDQNRVNMVKVTLGNYLKTIKKFIQHEILKGG